MSGRACDSLLGGALLAMIAVACGVAAIALSVHAGHKQRAPMPPAGVIAALEHGRHCWQETDYRHARGTSTRTGRNGSAGSRARGNQGRQDKRRPHRAPLPVLAPVIPAR